MVGPKEKKRKILFCIDAMARGGTELQLKELIERLDHSRYEPYLCTLRPSPPELTPHGCTHVPWDVPRLLHPSGLNAMWKFSYWLKANEINIVQTFFQDAMVFGGIAGRLAGVPVRLACFRDLGFWRTWRQVKVLRRIYPLMTGFLANSQLVKDYFVAKDGLAPDKIRVIYNGIDSRKITFMDHDGPTLDIGLVGNLNRRVKRTDLFLAAAGEMAVDHPGVTWHIVGDGKYRQEYQDFAHQLGLSDRTVFTGRISNVSDYLHKLQVGVICSDSEGFSNALLEYMLSGCAVVATDVGGNREAVTDGKNGLLVPPGDGSALVVALSRLLKDVSLRRRLARQARNLAESRFSWDRCLVAHEEVYANGPIFPLEKN